MSVLEERFVSTNCKDEEALPFYHATRLHILDNASVVVTEDTNMFDFNLHPTF